MRIVVEGKMSELAELLRVLQESYPHVTSGKLYGDANCFKVYITVPQPRESREERR